MIYNLSKEMVELALKILDKHDGYYIKEIDDVLQSCKQALSNPINEEICEKFFNVIWDTDTPPRDVVNDCIKTIKEEY